jgi:YVTN family beta-propeller protein
MMRLLPVVALLAQLAAPIAAAPVYRVIDRIAGPDGGWDYLHVDPASNRLLVAHGNAVMAVDLGTGAVTPGLAPGRRLHDVLPLGGELLVTDGGNATAVFADIKTGATLAIVPTGKEPDAAAIDPKSGLVLVMNHSSGDITLIDAKLHQAVATITVGGELEAAAVVDGLAYVNVEDRNEIAVVDIALRNVIARWPLPGCQSPTGIAVFGKNQRLIAACDGTSVIVNRASGRVLQTLATGAGADGVAIDAAHALAFVSAGRSGTLAVIATGAPRATIIQTLPTQVSARTITIDGRSGRLYLPAATPGPPLPGGGRPPAVPGSFVVLVVAASRH